MLKEKKVNKMSFALPTTITIVDKSTPRGVFDPSGGSRGQSPLDTPFERRRLSQLSRMPPTIAKHIEKYDTFKNLVKIARMEDILDDPQTRMTIFVPLDLLVPETTVSSCIDSTVQEKDVLSVNFETARTIVNSLIIPSVLTTTIMIQSAATRYKTRNVNNLTIATPHCVQFEPHTFNKPPFGIVLNGRSRIITPDILASNGMVHTIDRFPYGPYH